MNFAKGIFYSQNIKIVIKLCFRYRDMSNFSSRSFSRRALTNNIHNKFKKAFFLDFYLLIYLFSLRYLYFHSKLLIFLCFSNNMISTLMFFSRFIEINQMLHIWQPNWALSLDFFVSLKPEMDSPANFHKD